MLVNVAHAGDLPFRLPNSGLNNFIPMILVCIIFYFLIIRPHHNKLKKHKQMVDNIAVGDRVLTSGGIIGIVCRASNEHGEVIIEIAKNIRVTLVTSCIADILRKEQDITG